MTIDFSSQLESAINDVFPKAMIQKCVFHSIHLLTRALLKELNRLKREHFSNCIEEWNVIRRLSQLMEKGEACQSVLKLKYHQQQISWNIYIYIWNIFSTNDPKKVKKKLQALFLTQLFKDWGGKEIFLEKYRKIFSNRAMKFSKKGLKYISVECFRAWRGSILQLRREEEQCKKIFNDLKYLILMNPLNMKSYHRKSLRSCLKKLPWLRMHRKIMVKFYYQFRQPPEKRIPFHFLSELISNHSHQRLKSVIKTLIKNQDKIFYFQVLPQKFASKKSIRVVDESSNRIIQRLFFTQHGMRTLENMRMRISKRLECPIIISPTILEQYNNRSNID